MTRKDYVAIARAIQTTLTNRHLDPDRPLLDVIQVAAIQRTSGHIADAMQRDNPHFGRSRFMVACGFSNP